MAAAFQHRRARLRPAEAALLLLLALPAQALRSSQDAVLAMDAKDGNPADAFEVGPLLPEGSLVDEATGDPVFLVTAVALTIVADTANVVLQSARVTQLTELQKDLIEAQERIFEERADACFSVRSLEVQADLLGRATDAFVRFAGGQVPAELRAYSVSPTGELVPVSGGDNAAAQAAARNDLNRLIKSLHTVNSQLRRAMAAAVQSACHSASSGEIILQADVEQVTERLEAAQEEMLDAGLHLVQTVTAGSFTVHHALLAHGFESPAQKEAILAGKIALESLAAAAHLTEAELPDGMSAKMRDIVVGALTTIYGLSVAVAVNTGNVHAVDILVNIVFMMQGAVKLCTGAVRGTLGVTVQILTVVTNAMRLANNLMSLVGPMNPAIAYAVTTLSTITAYLRLTMNALKLQLETQQKDRMLLSAAAAEMESALMRSYGTCNSLGTAWGLAGTAEVLVTQIEAEVKLLPGGGLSMSDDGTLASVYLQYVRERPALAAKILAEAFRRGSPGVSRELISQAEALARVAPITDFAVARTGEQEKALGALGFVRAPCMGKRKARFLICRGCGDSVIVGMTVVATAAAHEAMESEFRRQPPTFGGKALPPDATLNFVQLPKEEGFQLLAFAKVPLQGVRSHKLPVLFELREDVFAIEGDVVTKQDAEAFQKRAVDFIKSTGSEVLSWRPSRTVLDFGDRLANGMLYSHTGSGHTWNQEYGMLDALIGHFADVSGAEWDRGLEGVVPPRTLRPFTHLTVTHGCGCSMGPLGNRFQARSANVVLLRTLEDDDRQKQTLRCAWRFDVLLSDQELTQEMVTKSSGSGQGLDCGLAMLSVPLNVPVAAPDLVIVDGMVMRSGQDFYEYRAYRIDPAKDTLVAQSKGAGQGPAGPIRLIDEDGTTIGDVIFQVWQRKKNPIPGPPSVDRKLALQPVVRDFRNRVGELICSDRCAIRRTTFVPEAIAKITRLPIDVSKAQATLKLVDRGEKCKLEATSTNIPWFPVKSLEALQSQLGALLFPSGGQGKTTNPGEKLVKAMNRIYMAGCEFEALLDLDLGIQCEGGKVPDLLLDETSGQVTEICRPAGLQPPVHKYVVSLDFSYHDGEVLRDPEKQVEVDLRGAGFLPWGPAVLWSSPSWNTDTFYWRRTLRQRLFVQVDPRVTTVLWSEVCTAKPPSP